MSGNGYDGLGVVKGRTIAGAVRIYDTTLRDGEQSPGISLTVDDKVSIAHMLDALGVSCIEAGFAASSEADRKVFQQLVTDGLRADLYSLSRCLRDDIDAAHCCGLKHVHLFIATSDIHLKYKLKMSRDEVLSKIDDSVTYAISKGMEVMFSCEDATRTEYGFLKEAFLTAVNAGASIIDIPDTVGVSMPAEMYELVSMLSRDIDVPIAVHCHNDLGLAVANSLAAVEAGASVIHTCVNGLGERSGNASTEEVALNLKLNYGVDTIDLTGVDRISKIVSRYTGYPVAYNKPLVGRNAFSHESGIHVHGILNNAATYEPYPPEMIGRSRDIAIGKHSGAHSLKDKLSAMGISFPDERLGDLLEEIKTLSVGGKEITDIELAAVAENLLWRGRSEVHVRLDEFVVLTGKNVTPTATVTVTVDGVSRTCAMTGTGPVDAAVNAIRAALDNRISFEELRLESITGGSDSLCEVTVLVRDTVVDGHISAGKAVGIDIVDTTVDAFMQAINRDYARSR